jgi:hypothetical protein
VKGNSVLQKIHLYILVFYIFLCFAARYVCIDFSITDRLTAEKLICEGGANNGLYDGTIGVIESIFIDFLWSDRTGAGPYVYA